MRKARPEISGLAFLISKLPGFAKKHSIWEIFLRDKKLLTADEQH